MNRKIIKVGDSAAVILPKTMLREANAKIGDNIHVNISKTKPSSPSVRPEIIAWTNKFIEEDKDLLIALKDA